MMKAFYVVMMLGILITGIWATIVFYEHCNGTVVRGFIGLECV